MEDDQNEDVENNRAENVDLDVIAVMDSDNSNNNQCTALCLIILIILYYIYFLPSSYLVRMFKSFL